MVRVLTVSTSKCHRDLRKASFLDTSARTSPLKPQWLVPRVINHKDTHVHFV